MMSLRVARAQLPIAGYLLAGGLSNLGNALSAVVYPWLIFDLTRSATAMGLVAFATLAPLVIGAVFGSLFIDRLGPRRVALAADGLSATTTIAAAALHGTGLLTFELLLGLALIGSLLDGPGLVAHDVRMPELARLAAMPVTRANLLDDLIDNGAQLAGPVLAGIALAFWGSGAGLMLLAAISLMALATTVATMPRFRLRQARAPVTITDCLKGPAFVFRTPQLRTPLLLAAFGMAIFIAVESVALPALMRTAGQPATDLGLFLGASAVGAIAINMLLLALGGAPRTSLAFAAAFAGFAFALGVLAMDRSQPALALAGAMLGICAGPLTPLLQTLLQTVPPQAIRARVLGSALGLIVAAAPVSVLMAGWAIDTLGGTVTLWGSAALCAIAALVSLGMTDGRRKPVPSPNAAAPAAVTSARTLPRSSGRVSLARRSSPGRARATEASG